MHIISLISYLSTSKGGTEISTFDILKSLHHKGHKITVVYEEDGDQSEPYQAFCTQTIKIKSFKLNSSFINDIFRIKTSHDAVVYSSQYDNLFFGCILSFVKNTPLISHLRLEAALESDSIRKLKQAFTLSRVDKFIAVSDAVRNDWSQKLGINHSLIKTIYNGIDLEQFHPCEDILERRTAWEIPQDTKVITYVGRLEQYKGVETLIRAASSLINHHPEKQIILLIAGKSLVSGEKYITFLKRLVSELSIEKSTRFLGHISDVKSLYQISDLVVVPSLWLEAFGRVTIEAMACGTPVIGSRVGGIPEVLSDDFRHFLFKPGDETELSDRLEKYIDWQTTQTDLNFRCRAHVYQKFNLDTKISEIEEVLASSINSYKKR